MKAVLFDFFGVICDERLWQWLHRHIPDADKRTTYFHKLADGADRGDIGKDGLYEELGAETGKPAKQVKQEVYDEIRLHQDVLRIMKRLHARYKVGIVTNADHHGLREIIRHYSLQGYFDGVVVSSAVGLIKPQPEIYQLACERLGVEPTETLFVDDTQANVDGAKQVGLEAVLFHDARTLEADLRRYGMLK